MACTLAEELFFAAPLKNLLWLKIANNDFSSTLYLVPFIIGSNVSATMVLVLDGNSENVAHVGRKHKKSVTAVYLNKYHLNKIRFPISTRAYLCLSYHIVLVPWQI